MRCIVAHILAKCQQSSHAPGTSPALSLSLCRDTEYASPFATSAQREGLRYNGGKLDDITVVVSRLCKVPLAPLLAPAPRLRSTSPSVELGGGPRGRVPPSTGEPESDSSSPMSQAD